MFDPKRGSSSTAFSATSAMAGPFLVCRRSAPTTSASATVSTTWPGRSDEAFTLAIVSRPVESARRAARTKALLDARDWCHDRAKQTVGEQRGASETHTENVSKNGGLSLVIVSAGKSSGSSDSKTEQVVESLSRESQNGLAVELEQVADHHLQRLKRAANVGLWETSVAFAAESEQSAEVLAGAFAAELAKPNESPCLPAKRVAPSGTTSFFRTLLAPQAKQPRLEGPP